MLHHKRLSLATTLGLAALALASLTVSAQSTAHEFIVSPAWLAARLNDPNVIVIHVSHGEYAEGHVPGAREMEYMAFTANRGSLGTELPDPDEVRAKFEALGVSDQSTVVVYAHQAPMATRALFTLSYLGIEKIAYLDGGLDAWRAAGQPVSRERPTVTRGRITKSADLSFLATHALLEDRIGKTGTAFIDTRTDGEYNGTGNRSGMPSVGHVAGARQLEWEDLFTDRSTKLKPRAVLEQMFRERTQPGDTVITYCWVGYRASATWFVARALGYRAMMYDGSYQDWSQRRLPTRAGSAP